MTLIYVDDILVVSKYTPTTIDHLKTFTFLKKGSRSLPNGTLALTLVRFKL